VPVGPPICKLVRSAAKTGLQRLIKIAREQSLSQDIVLLALQVMAGAPQGDRPREGDEVRVRLNKTLSSKYSREGDRFTATVVDPGRFNGAKITGHIASIKPSGRFKGATEMYLSFEQIKLRDGSTYPISAEIVRLYDARSGEHVDAEGAIETGGRGIQTLKRTGIGAVAGGVFGAIIGGGKGAAIGSVAGGGIGAGTAAQSRSRELVLDTGTELLIRVIRR
jgi:hypothetical protein